MSYVEDMARYARYSRQYTRRFWGGYVDAALWSSSDNSDDSGGDPLDANYSVADIDEESFTHMQSECAAFIFRNRRVLLASGLTPEVAGHCFWLNRNRHGTGFWDRDIGEFGRILNDASHAFGDCDLYVGDDGKVYAS